jgi:hypothetical protein
MPEFDNPALKAFIAEIGPEMVWAEVVIAGAGGGFALRHVADRELPMGALRAVRVGDLRKTVLFNAAGHFRALSASPDLPRGWHVTCEGPAELWRAVQQIYPGSIADWWAARQHEPPVTRYREFAGRQSGMYRIIQLLSDEQAGEVIRAACAAKFCIKRRLWSVEGLSADPVESKSRLPCLEPCAILMELARKSARIEQEPKITVQLGKSDLQSLINSAEIVAADSTREPAGNIASDANPRRLQLLLEKLKGKVERSAETLRQE